MRNAFLLAALVAALVAWTPSATAAATASCSTSKLVVWLNTTGDHAAGSAYYTLEFTNLSAHACTLYGYPGVSAVDLAGHPVGAPAGRDPFGTPKRVQVAPRATTSAVLQIADAGNFPASACHATTAAGLRVYPPGQKSSRVVPFPFPACSSSASVVLHVRAVGVGP